MEAVEHLDDDLPVVIVGSGAPNDPVVARVLAFAARRPQVHLLGHVADQATLQALWAHAGVYWHGHSVGGTNPALLQALGMGAPVLALDTPFNAEVIARPDQLVPADSSVLAERIQQLLDRPELAARYSAQGLRRVRAAYQWEPVCAGYETLLRRLAESGSSSFPFNRLRSASV
jgi:glycosyltransferase involved in cell wall biosynthesis